MVTLTTKTTRVAETLQRTEANERATDRGGSENQGRLSRVGPAVTAPSLAYWFVVLHPTNSTRAARQGQTYHGPRGRTESPTEGGSPLPPTTHNAGWADAHVREVRLTPSLGAKSPMPRGRNMAARAQMLALFHLVLRMAFRTVGRFFVEAVLCCCDGKVTRADAGYAKN